MTMIKSKFFLSTICLVVISAALVACGDSEQQNQAASMAAIQSILDVRDGAARYYESKGNSYVGIKASDLADPARGIQADGSNKVKESSATVTISGATKDTLSLSAEQGGTTCTVEITKGQEGTPSCS